MNNTIYEGHVCSHRHAFSLNNFLRRLLQPPEKIVGPYIKPGDTVVDLGCGPGFFTVPMAKMAGSSGRVIAVDLQSEMLDIVAKKLRNTSLASRVELHRCRQSSLDLDKNIQANFVLAYYMVHETPDQSNFFHEVMRILGSKGRLLVVEPPFHVSKSAFEMYLKYAEDAGLTLIDRPKGKGGKSILLTL
jgi:ubiquinone/menaquinone biosynthesis C-methylase UbiE